MHVGGPANYGPTALLNTIYKLYVFMLQKRLAAGLGDEISETQLGFRQKRSTSQPLYIFGKAMGDKMLLVFLDWEKLVMKRLRRNSYKRCIDLAHQQKS